MMKINDHALYLLLLIFLGISLNVGIFFTQQQDQPVFDAGDILFEHQTNSGNIVITQSYFGELNLAFISRQMNGFAYAGSTMALQNDDITLLTLPANHQIPFTTHAILSSNPALHEILVVETGMPIAHHARAKETTDENLSVFMVASQDFTGENALIIGLDANENIIFEIETD